MILYYMYTSSYSMCLPVFILRFIRRARFNLELPDINTWYSLLIYIRVRKAPYARGDRGSPWRGAKLAWAIALHMVITR